MSVRFLITKTFIPKKNTVLTLPIIDHICRYSNLLTNEASTFSGFMKSQSYWDLSNSDKIITMTKWDSIEDWDDWFGSENRKTINNQFDFLDIETITSHLRPKLIFNEIALL